MLKFSVQEGRTNERAELISAVGIWFEFARVCSEIRGGQHGVFDSHRELRRPLQVFDTQVTSFSEFVGALSDVLTLSAQTGGATSPGSVFKCSVGALENANHGGPRWAGWSVGFLIQIGMPTWLVIATNSDLPPQR